MHQEDKFHWYLLGNGAISQFALRAVFGAINSYYLTMNKYRLEVIKRLSYLRAGKLRSRGRANSPNIFERELDKFYRQGDMMCVLLIAMSELLGHGDSSLALCVVLVVRGRSGSGKGPQLQLGTYTVKNNYGVWQDF